MDNQSGNHFSRSRNVGRNIIFGYINRCVSLLLPFIVRTVVIYRFGALYLGMNSLPCDQQVSRRQPLYDRQPLHYGVCGP